MPFQIVAFNINHSSQKRFYFKSEASLEILINFLLSKTTPTMMRERVKKSIVYFSSIIMESVAEVKASGETSSNRNECGVCCLNSRVLQHHAEECDFIKLVMPAVRAGA